MLPTPVLSVSGKGFARLRISAWHFSPAPPILYAVRAIVYHKSRVLSRVLRDFSGSEAPGTPGAEPARHLLSLPRWCSQEAEPQRHGLALPLWKPQWGLASRGTCYPCLWFAFLPPIPPAPFPGGEGGVLRLFYARGSAPCIPGAEPARYRFALPLWHPAGGLLCLSPAAPCLYLLFCPLSPRPPSPVGKGEIFSSFRRGLRPRHPCIRPFAELTVSAKRAPCARSLRLPAKTTGSGSL